MAYPLDSENLAKVAARSPHRGRRASLPAHWRYSYFEFYYFIYLGTKPMVRVSGG